MLAFTGNGRVNSLWPFLQRRKAESALNSKWKNRSKKGWGVPDTKGWAEASAPRDRGSRRSFLLKAKWGQGSWCNVAMLRGKKIYRDQRNYCPLRERGQVELSVGKSLKLMKPKENRVPTGQAGPGLGWG